jgi:hypothetical protein
VITSHYFVVNIALYYQLLMAIINQKVVKPPTFVLWAQFCSCRPKAILNFSGSLSAERVNKFVVVYQQIKVLSFLGCKARHLFLAFCVINIDFMVSHIQVA